MSFDALIVFWPVLVASAMAGFVDSIGGGGGLLTVPALLSAGVPAPMLLGTNKGIAALGSTAALTRYARAGLMPAFTRAEWIWSCALIVCMAALGAGVSTLPWVLENLRVLVPILQMAVLAFLAKRWFFSPRTHRTLEAGSPTPPRLRSASTWSAAAAVGGYDGLFGPGTGTFFLSLFERAGLPTINANALTKVFNFSSNVGALIVFALLGRVIWPLSLCGAALYLLGNYLGAGVVIRNGQAVVRAVVIVTSLALLGRSLWTTFST